MKKALICGVSGQDGAYLAQLLLEKGYGVYGTSRDAQIASFRNLDWLGGVIGQPLRSQIQLESMVLTDFRSVLQVLTKVKPDEVYNLAGQSSVSLSFGQPVETLESIALGTLNLLEAIRFIGAPIRLYNAGSSECFGDTIGGAARETSPFVPRSPYAVAKAAAFWEVANYRQAYGLFACSGILFNHESPLRPERFVTQKIVTAACAIAAGGRDPLRLGNISIQRDWGWAPEYVRAMHTMLQQPQADDYIIATGQSYSLEAFVATTFAYFGLDWQEHVVLDPELLRPADISISRADPSKAKRCLGWQALHQMPDVARLMIEARLARPGS